MLANDESMPAKFPKYLIKLFPSEEVGLYNLLNCRFPKSPAVREKARPDQESRILAKFPFHRVLNPFYYLMAVAAQL